MSLPPLVLAGISVVLWSSLAWLTTLVAHVPPFLLLGLALLVGALPGLARWREFTRNPRVLALGVGGIFGYHFCLFMALRLAPAVEANLLNYLWPVLIVLLSPLLLEGYALRWNHFAGGLLAFAGAALVATGGHLELDVAHWPGLALAAAAAAVWSLYSVLTKKLPPFPTAAVSQFCVLSAALALAAHVALEPRIQLSGRDALIIVFLGLGPMGVAFYCWDAAIKKGDPRLIGALSYLTPLLSTLALVLLGGKPLSAATGVALALIVGGALLGFKQSSDNTA